MDCLVCDRIAAIQNGTNPYFAAELETGYVVLGDHQHFKGYTLFLCKRHAAELHLLDRPFRRRFLDEMSLTAEAVYRVFKPDKLNYELLGNGNATHMHWHIFPRVVGDTPTPGPVWTLPKEVLYDQNNEPSAGDLKAMTAALKQEIVRLSADCPD